MQLVFDCVKLSLNWNFIFKQNTDSPLSDVYVAYESFVTGSSGGLTPVIKIDRRIIGNGKFGKLSKKLNHLYEQLIEEEITQKKANAKR